MFVNHVSVCLWVPSEKSSFPVDWRLLAKRLIANIDIFCFFYCFNDFSGCRVFANQPTVHTGGVTRRNLAGGGSVAVADR